jgi:putative acyl-CoA dehydrogenase
MAATHSVFNQVPLLADANLFALNLPLREAVEREGAAWAKETLHTLGATLGASQTLTWADLANAHPPTLHTHDRLGNRIDEVQLHPSWHSLMRLHVEHGMHGAPWAAARTGAHAARAAAFHLFGQVENGTQCPITMTYAAIPALAKNAQIARTWLPKLTSREYDPRSLPIAEKRSALMGMGLTEKQGGSDVRTNTTFATYAGESAYGPEYRVTGHKWFFSAPMCDAFLVLAQTDRETSAGLSCFFVPRILDDGSRNAIRIQRLKNKLGNHSNASSEVEFEAARAWLVGDVGRGIPTILEMGNLTRLDCAIGSAGIMRGALDIALHHASQRKVFGQLLIRQPLMQNVLADLALEIEAATALTMRLARAVDCREADANEAALLRLMTPVTKYWICKRCPMFCAEAMEVLGGNGYVEETPLARFFRESPLNGIWEGSGNVMCLDVLRALAREECRSALTRELDAAKNANGDYDGFVFRLLDELSHAHASERDARRLTQNVALAVQASLLVRFAPTFVSDAFCASRLCDAVPAAFGQLNRNVDLQSLLKRAWPLIE